ncbi:site-specific integrase [Arthrobacter sp. AK01]|uniref:tyrosine-type recombinase/integrase n=1 Tax=Arthrobacter sp. AK01 TaxID=2894084 RepID=UPI001E53248B|nr:site-specific integrase [Arthrobacter sp. AK01]MCD4850091.1 site-specific integrase [Arthrobacter sp. AK01]
MPSVKKRPDGRWRARYRDEVGKEHARHFPRKIDAQRWLDEVTASVVSGTYVDPKTALTTVQEWSVIWLRGYENNRPSTVRQARTHLKRINAAFGSRALKSVRPSEVKTWTARLSDAGLADSTVYALHSRLGQLFSDAVHDGLLPKSPVSRRTASPVSRRTAPRAGKQRAYVASTEQVWALHDAMPSGLQPAVLLAAFAGLRIAEAVALRVSDVDFMRGIISPAGQYPGVELKTEESKTPIPIPQNLCLELSVNHTRWGSETLVTNEWGRAISPHRLEHYFREARATVKGLPEGFRFHDLRHYFASLLIAQGLDVKVVQKSLRHSSAKTTLDTYGHMWPDKEESARAAVASVLTERLSSLAEKHA